MPPYCNAEPLVFDDVPFRTEDFTDAQGRRRACHRCGTTDSFLDEIIGEDASKASGKTWQCSDADFCREQRESARAKEAQQA